MITTVKILGSNKLLAGIGKALFVNNVINLVSFVGMAGLIGWQVWKGTEGVKLLEARIAEAKAKEDKTSAGPETSTETSPGGGS